MQRPPDAETNVILNFGRMALEVMQQQFRTHTLKENTKKDNQNNQLLLQNIRGLQKALQPYNNVTNPDFDADTATDLLATINLSCHAFLDLYPNAWEENNIFAREYKKLFYNLGPDMLAIVGRTYPPKIETHTHVRFNITPDGKIEIIRPYPFYKKIAYEGGGVKGAAYGGVNAALTERRVMRNITCVAGSSAGAITAAIVALGYNAKALSTQIDTINFQKLQDVPEPGGAWGNMFGTDVGILAELYMGSAPANKEAFGEAFINSGRAILTKLREVIRAGIQRIIERATPEQMDLIRRYGIYDAWTNNHITFQNLEELALICPEENIKQLILTGAEKVTDSHTRLVLFSALHTPHMEIATALRISASIPNFFRSVLYNGKYHVDAGVILNLPYEVMTRPEFIPPGERDLSIAETLAFKFVSPSNPNVMFQGYQRGEPRMGENILLPELVAELNANRNRAAMLLRGDDAPLVIPVSNQDIKSTEFDLSEAKKKALYEVGYKMTLEYLDQYLIPGRGFKDTTKYNSIIEAMSRLNIPEIKLLLERLRNPEEGEEVFYRHGKPIKGEDTPLIDKRSFIAMLEARLKELRAAQPPVQSVEQQLQMRRAASESRRDMLRKLFTDDKAALPLLQAIQKKLNENRRAKEVLPHPENLTGAHLKEFIMQDTLAQPRLRNDQEYQEKINLAHELICECIAEQLNFHHPYEVRGEIYSIDAEFQKRRWHQLVDEAKGFKVDLLKQPAVRRYIQSLSPYQELQAWAAKYPKQERAELLRQFFHNLEHGNLAWYTSLCKCIRGVIKGPQLPPDTPADIMNVIKLFYNEKNTQAGEINLTEILRDLERDINDFMVTNLLRNEDNTKLLQDRRSYCHMMEEFSIPAELTRRPYV